VPEHFYSEVLAVLRWQGVDAHRAQRLGGIDTFKLRLGTCEQLVNERTERLGRGVLVRIGEHDS
jgi:hypothetical protein